MTRGAVLVLTLAVAALSSASQTAAPRAWQQRLDIDIPLPVPVVPLASVNPFAAPLDSPPQLLSSTVPRKVPVAGMAVAAAYVDAKGECLGAVPLELPFPGMTSALADELSSTRYEPARMGDQPQPSWTVVQVQVDGTVRESTVGDQTLDLPDASQPPRPTTPPPLAPPGNLAQLAATPTSRLTAVATPRRVHFKVAGRDAEVPVRALVHLTADGACDRFVILDLDPGFEAWLSDYLASWAVEPAQRDGQPVDCWMVLTARVQMKLSALASGSFRALADRSYSPQ
jgi:hypothetical protein